MKLRKGTRDRGRGKEDQDVQTVTINIYSYRCSFSLLRRTCRNKPNVTPQPKQNLAFKCFQWFAQLPHFYTQTLTNFARMNLPIFFDRFMFPYACSCGIQLGSIFGCNFEHLLGHLHNSHRLHFSLAISVTILPTHWNNVFGRKIIIIVIKDRDLGWGGEFGKVIFAPKPLPHLPLALPMSNTRDVSNNPRLSLHNLSDFIYEYWPSIVVS